MNVETADAAASSIAAAIGEPARARMLYCLADGRVRTSPELAMVVDVSPSAASVHLQPLETKRLADGARNAFVPNTLGPLRAARTCYDHIAGTLGVLLHDRIREMGWLAEVSADANTYDLTRGGAKGLQALGIGVDATRSLRRRFAFACVDWSERRPHLGGVVAAALPKVALKRKWVTQDLDGRILSVTALGRREMLARFGLQV
jgi:hypothetical protein